MRIYLVSHYDEYGSEDIRGTTDRDGLLLFINNYVRNVWAPAERLGDEVTPGEAELVAKICKRAKQSLPTSLLLAEADPGEPVDLSDGWGGLQLHVVDVEDK